MKKYIKRSLEPVIKKASAQFPAVILTGPRQSGKTTLLKHLFNKKYEYVSMDLPDIRASATADPRGFLDMHPPPVILDEIQYAPSLLPYIRAKIDSKRSKAGQYILTGSQNILLMENISESLAGRAAVLKLYPMSRRELEGQPSLPLPWEEKKPRPQKKETYKKLWSDFIRGFYPEPAIKLKKDTELWHASYVQTYLERDVRTLRQVGDMVQFQSFLTALAARSGQLLNLSDMSKDLGISVGTVKAWISVLEASHQIIILRPYFANVGKRLVKTPKIYFTDTGLLCYLVGLKSPEHAASSPMAGSIMETAVVGEIIKTLLHRGIEPRVWFWRTSTGLEVDILVRTEDKLVAVEVKASATPSPAMAASLIKFKELVKNTFKNSYVVHAGNVTLPLAKNITAIPFRNL